MALKAVLFDFNGVIINDEAIHAKLLNKLLIEENICPQPGEFNQYCLGRSDRACLAAILTSRGRVVSEAYLDKLVQRKAMFYQRELESMTDLPIYRGLTDLLFHLVPTKLRLAVVSGALRSEIELVLTKAGLMDYFHTIVAGDDVTNSKPAPDGYLLAVERLNQLFPDLQLLPQECLAIEDTPAGIEAAKRAGMSVVGVANTYPFHMMQRQANWAVDYLSDLELDRVQEVFARQSSIAP
ncbi:MAG: HAD family phosphatase [Cyanobacteria bacterium]|nr:HAD family phosphatase [Cyanobacteriota bacterium]MDW8199841.1 HAD family phosphatase [Cyanobacteriota bacterium SKYGB_h_bin112]